MSWLPTIFRISFVFFFTCHFSFSQGYKNPSDVDSGNNFQWPNGKKMALSLTFDDARISQIDKGIPILDKYKVKGTFYLSPNATMQRVEGWKKAIKNGHDIGNHSLVHPCTGNFKWSRDNALENYSLLSMGMELDSANKLIEEMLDYTPVSFAYPCGQTYIGSGLQTKSYVPLISSRFQTGRTWMDEAPNDPVFCDLSQLTGMELDGKTFNQVKKIIDDARENGSWLILAGHEMDDEGRQTSLLNTIDSICLYALDPANGIWIDHVQNIANYIRAERDIPPHPGLLPYRDPSLTIAQRIDDLMSRMTLPEKIGQLNMPCGYFSELGNSAEEKMDGARKFAEGTFYDGKLDREVVFYPCQQCSV
jgi:peptidoglycan/xylan/chitin deacetylase (PgdA/CDA1 family)